MGKTYPEDTLVFRHIPYFLRRFSVIDKDLSTPPPDPAEGDRYIVGAGATGAWAGKDNQLAEWHAVGSASAVWIFLEPWAGFRTYVEDEATDYVWNGTAWVKDGAGINLNDLKDVNVPTPEVGDGIDWDGTKWVKVPLVGSDEKVKADADDPTAGFLDGKVDGATLEVDTTAHKARVKEVPQEKVAKDETEAQTKDDPISNLKSNLNRIRWHIVQITGEAWGTVSHTIDSIWAKFHATTGHKHTGAENDSPKLVDIDSLTGAKFTIEDHTEGSAAPHQIEEADNRKILTNRGSTALNYHTLPSAAAGLGPFILVVCDADGLRCDCNAGETLRIAGNVSADGGNISSTTVGSVVWLIALNSTDWYAISVCGTWAIA